VFVGRPSSASSRGGATVGAAGSVSLIAIAGLTSWFEPGIAVRATSPWNGKQPRRAPTWPSLMKTGLVIGIGRL